MYTAYRIALFPTIWSAIQGQSLIADVFFYQNAIFFTVVQQLTRFSVYCDATLM